MEVVLRYIAQTWDFESLADARLVCRGWRAVIDSSGLMASTETAIDGAIRCADDAMSAAIILGRDCTGDAALANLRLMWETLEDANTFSQTLPHFSARIDELIMTNNLWIQLEETSELLSDVFKYPKIDILELGIRRRLQEMRADHTTAISCIKDCRSRPMWENAFGANTFFVSWERFQNHMMPDLEDSRCAAHAKAFLCFPGVDSVSCYAYNLMSCLYGPPQSMWQNFGSVMTGMGFVGIINSVQAESLLKNVKGIIHRNSFIIRYSRQYPELFAVTCIDSSTGEIWSARNRRSSNSVPILQYIAEMKVRGFDLAKFFLDERAVMSSAYHWSQSNDYGVRQTYSSRAEKSM